LSFPLSASSAILCVSALISVSIPDQSRVIQTFPDYEIRHSAYQSEAFRSNPRQSEPETAVRSATALKLSKGF
jgi:hypothetical protein